MRLGTATLSKKRKQELQSIFISAKLPQATDDRTANAVFRVLEPYEGKLSRTVLRGEREGNLPDLLNRTGPYTAVRKEEDKE